VDALFQAQLIGEFRFFVRGCLLDIPAQRQRGLLAVLLADYPRAVSARRLAEYLWDGSRPSNERAALHIHMTRLRRLLVRADCRLGSAIRTGQGSYRIDCDGLSTDLAAYQGATRVAMEARHSGDLAAERRHLEQALALWRGELLEDVPLAGAYDEKRLQLRDGHLWVLERVNEVRIAMGDSLLAVPELRRLAMADPLRESTWYLLMRALLEAGRSAEAVAAFHTARDVFVSELGVEPGVRLRELFHELLAA
jgi:DNA-binding SARP family transcriptional activator